MELIQDQSHRQNWGRCLYEVNCSFSNLVTLAAQHIQQEQENAEIDCLARAEKWRKEAKDWYEKMLACKKRYCPRRPEANQVINANLEDFSMYLDTMSLDRIFHWVRQ